MTRRHRSPTSSSSRRASSTRGLSQRETRAAAALKKNGHANKIAKTSHSGRAQAPPSVISLSDNSEDDNMNELVSKKFTGNFRPSFNDKPIVISDTVNAKVYFIGGAKPGEADGEVVSDIFCCDTTTMSWTDLTESMKFHDSSSLYSNEKVQPLPRLDKPGFTLFRHQERSSIILFGGYDLDEEEATSRIIVVDPQNQLWWEATTEGGPVFPRINPAIIAMKNRLYVFGGYENYRGDPQNISKYSIALFTPKGGIWTWEYCDEEYGNDSRDGRRVNSNFASATSICGGSKILLTPGKSRPTDDLTFTRRSFFTFHVRKRTIRMESVDGDFPRDIACYHGFPRPIVKTEEDSLVISLLIFAWVAIEPNKPDSDMVPDIWSLDLEPDEDIKHLNYRDRICAVDEDLDDLGRGLDLREVFMMKGRFFLVGYQPDEGADPDDLDKAVYNTYVEIPIPPPTNS